MNALILDVTIDGKPYTIYKPQTTNYYLIIQDNSAPRGEKCTKTIRIEQESGSRFRLLKTKIMANNGACGLFGFLFDAYRDNFMVCLADKVVKHMIYTVKEANA